MTEMSGNGPEAEQADDARRREMAEMQERLDAQSDGDGLGAEAGKGDETGLTEG
ncbi:hypothetical protein [uncultured Nocardioides sp.]|nr:hypothetical protein [uncultured Nocardioides sp.]